MPAQIGDCKVSMHRDWVARETPHRN